MATRTQQRDPTDGDDEPSGRAATEILLEDTAAGMVRDQGVLAGLNLQELADRAGVNRGLVYHYYGSRGALLRRAFLRRLQPLLTFVDSLHDLPFEPRLQSWFRGALLHAAEIRFGALLVLDGTTGVEVMPRMRQTQRELARDVAEGHLDPTVDRKALNALVPGALYGYMIFRESFAVELGLTVEQLDKRVGTLFDRLLEGLRP